ncbi:MAG: hypothetical protein A2Y38_21100 [Spirochaetes bacterium GWB1_59_5]|nr:MAG: hypothetical protein A2Y38_21100 [Spirochaetes bacterium GWB1_59_5]
MTESRSLNIMIVEDERIISMMLSRMVERLGHHVCACVTSAPAAIEALDRVIPDLAFLDINLEGEQDGIAVGIVLRERLGIPFVYATAYTDAETKARATATAPLAFLAKPIDLDSIKSLCDLVSN